MTLKPSLTRWTLAALALATGLATFSTAALADPGGRRWKHVDHGRWGRHGSRVVVVREVDHHRGAGPALAGLVGGFILGSALSHAQPVVVHERECAPPPPRYRYEDAYGNRWWDTLDECSDAAWGRYGPRVIRVVNDRTDVCVQVLYWKHGHWVNDRDDRDDWDDD